MLDDQEYEYWRPTADGNLQTQDIGVGLTLQEFILYTFNTMLFYLRSRITPPPPVLLATLEGIDPHTAATEGGKRKQQREEFSETQGSSVVLEEGVCSPSLLLPTQWMEIGCQEDPCKSLSGYSSAGLA